MKVCFYSGVFARQGGIEEFTKDLALVLRQRGVDVRVICAGLHNPMLAELRAAGVEVVSVPVVRGCSWNIPDYALLPVARFAMKGADVVIHQKPFKLWFYPLLPSGPSHVYLTAYHPADQFGHWRIPMDFFAFFDAVFTQTEEFCGYLRARGLQCPVNILPLIPPDPTTPAPGKGDQHGSALLRVGMMGRLEKQKNPFYALGIVSELRRCLPEGYEKIEFHVYGDGTLAPELEATAGNLGVHAELHGRYERKDAGKIVADNDIFLITSLSEGQCIVALEILAGGRPLFATPAGALPVILAEEGRGSLLPWNNASAAAQCISEWIGLHPDQSAADIQQSYLNDYNRDDIQQRYVELIRQTALRK